MADGLNHHRIEEVFPLMMDRSAPIEKVLLTPSEVADIFRVDPKTVTRWAIAGKLTAVRTLGGHRRYRASEVRALFEATTTRMTIKGKS